MAEQPFFSCPCGSTVLAVSHRWTARANMEEVGVVGDDGKFALDPPVELAREDVEHEWIAYCGGCGHGVTVNWLDGGHVRLALDEPGV
jgi:hypothetical protein